MREGGRSPQLHCRLQVVEVGANVLRGRRSSSADLQVLRSTPAKELVMAAYEAAHPAWGWEADGDHARVLTVLDDVADEETELCGREALSLRSPRHNCVEYALDFPVHEDWIRAATRVDYLAAGSAMQGALADVELGCCISERHIHRRDRLHGPPGPEACCHSLLPPSP